MNKQLVEFAFGKKMSKQEVKEALDCTFYGADEYADDLYAQKLEVYKGRLAEAKERAADTRKKFNALANSPDVPPQVYRDYADYLQYVQEAESEIQMYTNQDRLPELKAAFSFIPNDRELYTGGPDSPEKLTVTEFYEKAIGEAKSMIKIVERTAEAADVQLRDFINQSRIYRIERDRYLDRIPE